MLHKKAEGKYICALSLQVIEFESTALMIGQLGLRVNLIAYPVVSIRKVSILA